MPLDRDGFLEAEPSSAEDLGLVPGALVSPSVAAEAGSLVLLGEPGIGKSTVFTHILPADTEPDTEVVRIDGSGLVDETFRERLGRFLERLPVAGGGSGGVPKSLIVVLDQVDESPMIKRLPGAIESATAGRDTSGLRFLIACRTADYPTAMNEVLNRFSGECVVADLAPLRRSDAIFLCDALPGVDGHAVIEAAIAAGAGALASVPLTLDLLLRTYKQGGRLDGAPSELFMEGVKALLAEHDGDRDDFDVSLDQRLAIAARAAAWLVLSGRHTIWGGRALEASDRDLLADSLVGGREPIAGASFEVQKPAVVATLRTALFTGRGPNRQAFRHASMAAYLAATYLTNHRLPQAQLESLFLVAAPDGASSIPTMLRETAAWLVTLDPNRSSWLVPADPESLVAHSSIVHSDPMRALLVEALLRRASEVELARDPWLQAKWELAHPGLDDQLLAVLEASGDGEPDDWGQVTRVRLAVRIAQYARSSALAEPLLKIAESDDWSAHMRFLAATAAAEVTASQ